MESWLAKFCMRCEVAFLPHTNHLSCDGTVRKHCPHRPSDMVCHCVMCFYL